MIRARYFKRLCTSLRHLPVEWLKVNATTLTLSSLLICTFAARNPYQAVMPVPKIAFKKVKGGGKGGAVFDPRPPRAWDTWVTGPSVIFDGKSYRMWYASMFHSNDGPRGIGLATSVDTIEWHRENEGQPVLTVGVKGRFDSAQILEPEVLFNGHKYFMWYTGIDGTSNSAGIELERIGLATSRDGIHWERANNGNPVFELGAPGSFDDTQVAYPSIIRDGEHYRMWYSAYSEKTNHSIACARSTNGVHWERDNDGQPVTGLSPAIALGPSVIRWNNGLLMFYTGAMGDGRWSIFAATSDQGFMWTMLNEGNPVAEFGTGDDFDRDNLSHPYALLSKGNFLVWYIGFNRGVSRKDPLLFRIGLAEVSIKD